MKIELIRDGDIYRVKGKKRATRLPDRLTVEIHADNVKVLDKFKETIAELWYPIFPAGSERAMEEHIKRKAEHGRKGRIHVRD